MYNNTYFDQMGKDVGERVRQACVCLLTERARVILHHSPTERRASCQGAAEGPHREAPGVVWDLRDRLHGSGIDTENTLSPTIPSLPTIAASTPGSSTMGASSDTTQCCGK